MKKCEEIQILFEQSQSGKIKLTESMQMRLHLMMCKCCQGYTADSLKINEALKNENFINQKCSEEEIDQLLKAIRS